jgi:RNA polymerase sigma-70 factor (ECF subfamily)
MDRTQVFSEHRPLLFSIAYRMLGSVMDAEDAVQETFLRWDGSAEEAVRSPKAYLSTVVTRLCIDQLRSAKTKREQYIGPWLPEPLITEETAAIDEHLATADSLSMAFLVLLERLSPVERAVFLLREVFDYPYDEIAQIVGKSEANCRQMAHRAKSHVKGGQRFEPTPEQLEEISERFLRATAEGDIDGLIDLLTEDVTVWSDGGGVVAAALNPIQGPDRVARFFIGLARKLYGSVSLERTRVNGRPGFVAYLNGTLDFVAEVGLREGRIESMRIVRNPEKLRHLTQAPHAGSGSRLMGQGPAETRG